MPKLSFVENKEQVAQILNQIGNRGVRLFQGPASYYKMRRLEDAGYVEHDQLDQVGPRGHAHVGFVVTDKGRQLVTKHYGRPATTRTRKKARS